MEDRKAKEKTEIVLGGERNAGGRKKKKDFISKY